MGKLFESKFWKWLLDHEQLILHLAVLANIIAVTVNIIGFLMMCGR